MSPNRTRGEFTCGLYICNAKHHTIPNTYSPIQTIHPPNYSKQTSFEALRMIVSFRILSGSETVSKTQTISRNASHVFIQIFSWDEGQCPPTQTQITYIYICVHTSLPSLTYALSITFGGATRPGLRTNEQRRPTTLQHTTFHTSHPQSYYHTPITTFDEVLTRTLQ